MDGSWRDFDHPLYFVRAILVSLVSILLPPSPIQSERKAFASSRPLDVRSSFTLLVHRVSSLRSFGQSRVSIVDLSVAESENGTNRCLGSRSVLDGQFLPPILLTLTCPTLSISLSFAIRSASSESLLSPSKRIPTSTNSSSSPSLGRIDPERTRRRLQSDCRCVRESI